MAENKLADLSMDVAVSILKVTDGIKGHYSLINQLERSATSIGANLREVTAESYRLVTLGGDCFILLRSSNSLLHQYHPRAVLTRLFR